MSEVDMSKFSTAELQSDLVETDEDIRVCEMALAFSVVSYSGGKTQDRWTRNARSPHGSEPN